jgi:hypothetical protein
VLKALRLTDDQHMFQVHLFAVRHRRQRLGRGGLRMKEIDLNQKQKRDEATRDTTVPKDAQRISFFEIAKRAQIRGQEGIFSLRESGGQTSSSLET